VWLRPRRYRLSASVSVFDRKSCFTFGRTYGFGRMCYVTFGLLSAKSKTSAFGRPLLYRSCGAVLRHEMLKGNRYVSKAQYTPPTPTRLNCRVESRRQCVRNSQLVGDSLDESEQICQQRSRVASCRRRERTRRQS